MGIDDMVNRAKGFLDENRDRIDEARRSEKAEGVSDNALDAGAEFVKKITPDHLDGKVDDLRDRADRAVGNE